MQFFRRYIKDSERKDLLQQALSFCSQTFKDILKQHSTDKRNDTELLALIVEIYKAHKKCQKNSPAQKETTFSSLMIETYKVYIQGKVAQLPENANFLDLAIKLCQHEINFKNRLDKQGVKNPRHDDFIGSLGSLNNSRNLNISDTIVNLSAGPPVAVPTEQTTIKPVAVSAAPTMAASTYIPGLSRPRGRPPGSKNLNSNSANASPASGGNTGSNLNSKAARGMDSATMSAMMALYSNPSALMASLTQFTDPASLNAFLAEYYKLASLGGMSQLMTGLPKPQTTKTAAPKPPKPQAPKAQPQSMSSSHPSLTATLNAGSVQSKLPQLDIQSLFSSATTVTKNTTSTSIPKPATTVISVGSGELTITPSMNMGMLSNPKGHSMYPQQTTTSLLKSMQPQAEMPKPPKRSVDVKDTKRKNQNNPQTSNNLFKDMPGISVTSVQPSNIPRDLPKSLSITPTPAGYSNKATIPSQPFVTLQPEKSGKAPKQKKQRTDQWMKNPYSRQSGPTKAAALSGLGAGLDQILSMPDFNQQLAMFNKYNEMLKSANTPKSQNNFMTQFENFLSYPPLPGVATQKPKTKPTKGLNVLPPGLSINTAPKAVSQLSNPPKKGTISVKQLQTLQQQPAKSDKGAGKSMSAGPSGMPMFPMPDVKSMSSSLLNQFAMQLPTAAHSSSLRKTVPPVMPMMLSPTGGNLSANLQIR